MQPIYCLYIQHFWPFGRGQQHFRPKGPEVLYIMSQQSQPFGPVVLVKSFMKSSKMCCLRLLYKNSVISVNEDLAVLFKHFKESVCHKHCTKILKLSINKLPNVYENRRHLKNAQVFTEIVTMSTTTLVTNL